MKRIYNLIFAFSLLSVKAFAAYSPNAITMMSCDDGSLTMNHTGNACALEVTKTSYNSSGLIDQNIKRWYGIVSITDATQQSVDISSAGFSTILGYHVTVNDNVFNHVVVNSASTTTIVLDTYNLQTTGLVILGQNVLGTASMSASNNLTGLQASISVTGY